MATVLIVEDDLLARTLLKRFLEGAAHQACFADTVLGGWQLLQATINVDMVVLDNVLGEEFGWQFLRDLRSDPIFRELPVLVYTATSDRGSVIKYLKMGVQNILVKPYVKGRVMEELDKALNFSWRDKLFEPVEHVCHRLDLDEDEYYRMLHLNAETILDVVHSLKGAIGTTRMRKSTSYLEKFTSISRVLGVSALDDLTDRLQRHLLEEDLNLSLTALRQAEVIAKLMQHRFAVHFQIQSDKDLGESISQKEAVGAARREVRKQEWTRQARNAAREAWQQMTHAPFHDFARLITHAQIPPARWDAATLPPGQRYLGPSLRPWLHRPLSEENTLDFLSQIPGLPVHLGRIVSTENDRVSGARALKKALDIFGAAPLLAAMLLSYWQDEARRLHNPLDLRPLAKYTLANVILYWELSRKLPLAREVPLAGLMPLLGQWLWATTQPVRYAVLLAQAQASMTAFMEGAYRIFAESAEETAFRWLMENQAPAALVASARDFQRPEQAEGHLARIVASMAQLADALNAGMSFGFRGYLQEDGTDAFVHASAWQVLKTCDVEMSLAPAELLSALDPLLKRIPRQVELMLELPSMPLLPEAYATV
ncbi:MAG: response regulator [Verrucomicrobiota bacterium JB022]|nr:response regulator [Verrucomicrobiota bacterium JB022]